MKLVETPLRVFESPGKKTVYCLDIVDDILYAGTADSKVRAYNVITGVLVRTFSGHTNYVTCLRAVKGTLPQAQAGASASPSAAEGSAGCLDVLLFSGSNDKTARLWDGQSERCVRTYRKGHTSHIYCLCVEPSGQRMYTGGGDNVIVEWNVATEERVRVLKGHTDWVRDMQLVGRYLFSGSNDATIRKWDTETGQCVYSYPCHNRIFCLCIAGDKLFSGSSDKLVRAMDCETGAFVRDFSGHKGPVLCLQATSAGDIITSSGDKCVRQWDVRTGECITLFKGHGDWVRTVRYYRGVVFSGGDDGYIRVWSVYDGTPADSAFGGSSIMSESVYAAAPVAIDYDRRSIASSTSRVSMGSQFVSGAGASALTAAVHAMASGSTAVAGGAAVSRALLEAHDMHTRRINELEALNFDQLKTIEALEAQRDAHIREHVAWMTEKARLTEQIRALQASLREAMVQAPDASQHMLRNLSVARQCLDDIEAELTRKGRPPRRASKGSSGGEDADDEA